MILDYATLTGDKTVSGSIKNWANSDQIDVEGVLLDAQSHIFTLMRVREMRTSAVLTANAGMDHAKLPDNCLVPGRLHLWSGRPITKIATESDFIMRRNRTQDGRSGGVVIADEPTYWCLFDERANFDCRVRTDQMFTLFYYGLPENLSPMHPKNFLSTRYSHILRAMCMAYTAIYRKDMQSYTTEMKRASDAISIVNMMADEARMGASDESFYGLETGGLYG